MGNLYGSSVTLSAPGNNQVLNDLVWKDAKFSTFVSVQESAMTPDDDLPDLSMEVTLQNSVFQDISYSSSVISTEKQTVVVKNSRFENVDAFQSEPGCYCQALVECSTGTLESQTSTSNTYCTVENNCFTDITASDAIVTTTSIDNTTQVLLSHSNNYVNGFSFLNETMAMADPTVCEGGIGISTQKDGTWNECKQLSDVDACPVGGGTIANTDGEDSGTEDATTSTSTNREDSGTEDATTSSTNGEDSGTEDATTSTNGNDSSSGSAASSGSVQLRNIGMIPSVWGIASLVACLRSW